MKKEDKKPLDENLIGQRMEELQISDDKLKSLGEIDLESLSDEIHKQELNKGVKVDTKYQHTAEPMEKVEQNIEEYIIPELQEACKILWSKNIFTLMVSNRNDGGSTYIYLNGGVTGKNIDIWNKLNKKYPNNFYKGTRIKDLRIQIADTTKMTEKEIADAFIKMVSNFELQDVSSVFYQTAEEYLVEKGYCDEVPNPDYVEAGPMPTGLNYEALNAWLAKINCPKTIKVFNKSKMGKKTFEQIVRENGDENRTDFENEKVYCSTYFYNKHLNYVKANEESNSLSV